MPSVTPWNDSPLKVYPKRAYGDPHTCYFCNTPSPTCYVFQGEPICGECNQKVLDRIKHLLSI